MGTKYPEVIPRSFDRFDRRIRKKIVYRVSVDFWTRILFSSPISKASTITCGRDTCYSACSIRRIDSTWTDTKSHRRACVSVIWWIPINCCISVVYIHSRNISIGCWQHYCYRGYRIDTQFIRHVMSTMACLYRKRKHICVALARTNNLRLSHLTRYHKIIILVVLQFSASDIESSVSRRVQLCKNIENVMSIHKQLRLWIEE